MTLRKFKIKIDGKSFLAEVEEIGEAEGSAPIVHKKETPSPSKEPEKKKESFTITGGSIVAPMPGKVIAVKCSKGQSVKKGDVVLILEAMKMEQEIKSKADGTVTEIKVSEGDTVQKDDVLIIVS
jgi:biotin carboxyl carrier protein